MTMYLEHFGLREAPFRITPHTEFFFSGANRGATLEALAYAITAGEGLVKVTGEVGTGKTMLCRVLMERLPTTVETLYLAIPSLTRDEMLLSIASELDIDTQGANTTQLIKRLQQRLVDIHAEGRQVVALIDEAHAMPAGTLEEIRLLSNLETGKEKLLQIVLFGQPELDEHLNQAHMRQLKERITHAFVLDPLPPRDIKEYIDFRLRAAGYRGPDLFGPEALRILTDASEGLTRRINIYADKTLLAAFAAGTHTVTADHARAAVSDTQIVVAPKPAASRRTWAVAGAGVAVGIAIGYTAAALVGPGRAPAPTLSTPVAALPAPVPTPPPAGPVEEAAASRPSVPASSPIASAPAVASIVPPAPVTQAAVSPPPAKAREAAAPEARRPSSLDRMFESGSALLDGKDGERWVIQLLMADAREPGPLRTFLADASRGLANPDGLSLYRSGSAESPKVGVIYGAFASRREAQEALNALPPGARQFQPYVRAVDSVRADVRRGGPD